jgi:hypothetical protein
MADPLYLSLWFPRFSESEMMPRLLSLLRQFMFSASQPGISALAIHPVSWSEPTILERRFRPGIEPEEAVAAFNDLLHQDYAYVLEAYWDLWILGDNGEWSVQPRPVTFIAHGLEFDEGSYQESGHIQVDFGLDTPFVFENVDLTDASAQQHVRANVQKLVNFTNAVEKNCGVSGRVLWSESEENLAQKLVAQLQKTH